MFFENFSKVLQKSMWGIRVGMQGIEVRMQGIEVGMLGNRWGMQGIKVGIWGIRVAMRGIRVGMRVYTYLTGILQGFYKDIPCYIFEIKEKLISRNTFQQLLQRFAIASVLPTFNNVSQIFHLSNFNNIRPGVVLRPLINGYFCFNLITLQNLF